MPRATGPAAEAAMPASAEAANPTATVDEAPPAAPSVRWRYTGPPGRIYTNVPLTCHGGEVIAWPTSPADDGAWEPTTDPVTALADNHPRPAEEV